MTIDECVWLRPVQPCDLPRMYDMQLDPESNRMAVTIPRTEEAFDSHWAKALDDPKNIVRSFSSARSWLGPSPASRWTDKITLGTGSTERIGGWGSPAMRSTCCCGKLPNVR